MADRDCDDVFPDIREILPVSILDEVREFKITLYKIDGSIEVFTDDTAFWGTHSQVSTVANMLISQNKWLGNSVYKWEIEETDGPNT